MSEHAWTSEHIAALVAGGLDAAESERAQAHMRECAECTAAICDARALDAGLTAMFAPVRPAPALEDQLIQTLRARQNPVYVSRSRLRWGWQRKLALGVAASVGLGILGAGLSLLDGGLPLPGELQNRLRMASIALRDDLARPHGLESSADGSALARIGWVEIPEQPSTRDPEAMAQDLFGEQSLFQGRGRSADIIITPPYQVMPLRPPSSSKEASDPNSRSDYYARQQDQQRDSLNGRHNDNGTSFGMGIDGTTKYTPPRSDKEKKEGDGEQSKIKGALRPGMPPAVNAPPFQESSLPSQKLPEVHYYKPSEYKQALEFGPPILSSIPYNNRLVKTEDNKADKPTSTTEGKPPAHNPAEPGKPQTPAPTVPPPAPPEAPVARKIIRSGDIEFEIDAFDTASATVISLVDKIKGGFVATINSEKLPNGKVKGSIVVRVPPDKLDQFVLDLRRDLGKTGELKGQRIGSQDITKQYYDTESRLKAARYMEQRLLTMIKEGKGDIKQLLEAEKELGVWRTKIDEMEGEKRYFDNQVSLSTLTITLAEKEIRAAAGLTESERVQTGIEVEDVEQAHRDALAAVTEAKGRVTRSEVKQLAAGQFNATLNFEVAPEQAGPVRDRLKQLGRTARLEVDRVQQAEGGTPQRDSKVKRGDTIFIVQFYNLANIAPRESNVVQLAAPEVPAAYRALVEAVSRAKGRIITSKLDENDRQNITAQLDFEIKRSEEAALQTALTAAGETIARNVNRAPDTENVTDAKILFRMTLLSAARLRPREVITLGIEVDNVDATLASYTANVAEAKGRVIDSNIGRQASGKVLAALTIDVPLGSSASLAQKLMAAGVVKKEQRVRDPQAPDGQYATARIEVVVANKDLLVPKDEGLGKKSREGLGKALGWLLDSITFLIIGLCFVLPWAVVGYGIYRVGRWLFGSPAAVTPSSAAK